MLFTHADPSKCGLTTSDTDGHSAAAHTEYLLKFCHTFLWWERNVTYATPMQHMRAMGGTLVVKAKRACVPGWRSGRCE